MPTTITLECADTVDARTLIAELEAELEPLYPRESRHGYSVEMLLAEAVTFFLIRSGDTPAGCGGWKPASISAPPSRYTSARASSGFRLLESTKRTRSAGSTRSCFNENPTLTA